MRAREIAVWAESLYLANLLVAPGLAFVALWWLSRQPAAAEPLARGHCRQTLAASIFAGVLLVIVNLLIVLLGGYHQPSTWVVVILYFTTCHSTLILLGVLGLVKAMAGQDYRFPLIGGLPGVRGAN
jgi:uncharacterized Tic20 family protein